MWGEDKGVGRARENPIDKGKSLLVFNRASLCFPCWGRGASASHRHSRVGSSGSAEASWAPPLAQKGTSCAFHGEKKGLNLIQRAPLNPREEGESVLFPDSDLELYRVPNRMMWGWLVIYLLDGSFLWMPLAFILLMLLPDFVIFVINVCGWVFIIKLVYTIPHISCRCSSTRHVKRVEPKLSPKVWFLTCTLLRPVTWMPLKERQIFFED